MAVSQDSLRKSIHELLKGQYLAVLATNTGSSPYTSLVGFVAGKELKEIFFATFTNTHKYQNIIGHPDVSLLIDSRTNRADDFKESSAVTVLGKADMVLEEQRDTIVSLYLERFSHLRDFVNDPQCALVQIAVSRYILVQRFQEVFELIMQ